MNFWSVEDNYFPQTTSLNVDGRLLIVDKPLIMGIINCTPDSFYSESRNSAVSQALISAETMLSQGASILDIGGFSTRPGATQIDSKIELERVSTAIQAISKEFPEAILSIDTFRSEVAERALDNGTHIVNDVSGGIDTELFKLVGKRKVPYVLTHTLGDSTTWHDARNYEHIYSDVVAFFSKKITELRAFGVNDIILDPGFGFSKNVDQNYELFNFLRELKLLGLPILVGISRKSMINKVLHVSPENALNGTTILNTLAIEAGASILRVHDVLEASEIVRLREVLRLRL